MERYEPEKWRGGAREKNCGEEAAVVDLPREAGRNPSFRTARWTGEHLQLTLMVLRPWEEIGAEVHPGADQMLRVEEGQALVSMGPAREKLNVQRRLGRGEAVFVPGGTWHNVRNAAGCPLRLSSLYAPPQHPRGTVHPTKADAEREEWEDRKRE